MGASEIKSKAELLISKCASDGFEILLPEYPAREKVARVADVDVEATFPTEDSGAIFRFKRRGKEIYRFTAKDLVSSSVWIAVENRTDNQAHIAFTYSDGGAIGAFHVRVFLIDAEGVKDTSGSIDKAVADFKARHYCKTRGNNVTALKWIAGSLLLLTEVYPTGDCGSDLGHLEGYLVTVPTGEIIEHFNLSELKHYPGICLEGDDQN